MFCLLPKNFTSFTSAFSFHSISPSPRILFTHPASGYRGRKNEYFHSREPRTIAKKILSKAQRRSGYLPLHALHTSKEYLPVSLLLFQLIQLHLFQPINTHKAACATTMNHAFIYGDMMDCVLLVAWAFNIQLNIHYSLGV